MNKASFGIIGLGVMGRGLAKNIANKGFNLSVYNRTTETEKDVVSNFLASLRCVCYGITKDFIAKCSFEARQFELESKWG